MSRKPDCIFLGAGKAGSTWLWHCFRQHPQVFVHNEMDTTRYFSLLYHLKDRSWYEGLFADARDDQVVVEMCNDYLRDSKCAQRIHQDNPNVKLIACLREPIERSFSAYWHGKRKNEYTFEYADITRRYVAYSMWMKSGFYADHLERFLNYFSRDQILVLFYDELRDDPQGYLNKVWNFIGVDEFRPSEIDRKVNAATPRNLTTGKNLQSARKVLLRLGLLDFARRLQRTGAAARLQARLASKSEYAAGIPPELRSEILRMTRPEVERLEKLLSVDLSHWKR